MLKTGRYPKHWNIPSMTTALPKWLRRWANKTLRTNFTNVLKTTRMYIIPQLPSCSHAMTKDIFIQGLQGRSIYTAHLRKQRMAIPVVCTTRYRRSDFDLVGGKNKFAEKLDSMFTYHPGANDELPIFSTGMIGQYAHGNEPSHHVIYLIQLP